MFGVGGIPRGGYISDGVGALAISGRTIGALPAAACAICIGGAAGVPAGGILVGVGGFSPTEANGRAPGTFAAEVPPSAAVMAPCASSGGKLAGTREAFSRAILS